MSNCPISKWWHPSLTPQRRLPALLSALQGGAGAAGASQACRNGAAQFTLWLEDSGLVNFYKVGHVA